MLSGLVLWPLADAPDVVRRYRDWCAEVPDEMTTALVVRRAPAIEGLPPERRGEPVVGVIACWCGALEHGDRVWAPMCAFGDPLVDLTEHRPFVEHQSMLDASYPHGRWVHMRSCDVPALSDEVLAIVLDHAARIRSEHSGVVAWQAGGAVARRDRAATAFGDRGAGFIFNITGQTEGRQGFADERAWVRAFGDDLAGHDTGVYVNFLMEEGDDRVRHAYGADHHARLRALKRTWDPHNVLHRNQNIRP